MKTINLLIAFAAVAGLAGCSKTEDSLAAKPIEKPPVVEAKPTPEELAKKAMDDKRDQAAIYTAKFIQRQLRDPDSLKWEIFRANDDGSVICMRYRAKNGFGGMNVNEAVVVNNKISKARENIRKHCTADVSQNMREYVEEYLPML